MTNAGNDVTTIAANVTGAGNAFSYTDANALTIGTVDGINGITTNNGAITVTTTNGALTVSNTAGRARCECGHQHRGLDRGRRAINCSPSPAPSPAPVASPIPPTT